MTNVVELPRRQRRIRTEVQARDIEELAAACFSAMEIAAEVGIGNADSLYRYCSARSISLRGHDSKQTRTWLHNGGAATREINEALGVPVWTAGHRSLSWVLCGPYLEALLWRGRLQLARGAAQTYTLKDPHGQG